MPDASQSAPSSSRGNTEAERKVADAERKAAQEAARQEEEKRKADKEKAAEEAKAAEEEAPHYALDELLENARTLTGYSRHMLAGALSGSDRKTFTVEEAKAEAKRFAKKPVGEKEEK